MLDSYFVIESIGITKEARSKATHRIEQYKIKESMKERTPTIPALTSAFASGAASDSASCVASRTASPLGDRLGSIFVILTTALE
jgi:hypothetical protein